MSPLIYSHSLTAHRLSFLLQQKMIIPIIKTIPGSLGTLSGGKGRTGGEIYWLVFGGLWIKGCYYSSALPGEKSGVLFISGFLPQGMEEPREKLIPVGHEDATCLDFKHVPFHASLRTSWLLCVQSLDLIW